MTPDAHIQTLARTAPTGEPDTLYEEVSDPVVARGAQHLIVRSRLGQRFEIEALDAPHAALASIGDQLDEAGLSHALAEPFIAALRRYIMKNGGAFARAANAKPVRIHMIVADRMPKSCFDNAMTELACLGPREVKVEGATRVNVRATPSGTATSSNAADVDAMFAQVRGLFLWVRFEAPTKEDLDGLMNTVEATLAGVAQSVGGAMGAGDFKKLLEMLQKDGAITPDIIALVGKLIRIQEMTGKDGKITMPAAELGALLKDIGALMDKGQGLIPPALVEAVMRSMADMAAANPVVAEFLAERGFSSLLADNDNIKVEERLDAIMEKVAALASLEGLDPALAAELAEILQKAQTDLKAGTVTPAALLDTLGDKLGAIAARGDIPQVLMDGIGKVLPEITALRDSPQVASGVPEPAQGEAILAMLEEIAAKIEKGEVDINTLPPEMKALIEKIGGVETLMQKEGREARVEALAEALVAKQATELSAAVHAAVVVMAQPDAILALPLPIQVIAENFITQNPAIVDRAATPVAAPLADISVSIETVQKNEIAPAANEDITPLAVVVGMTAATPIVAPVSSPPSPVPLSSIITPAAPPSTFPPDPVAPASVAPPASVERTDPPTPVQPAVSPPDTSLQGLKAESLMKIDPAHPALPILAQKMDEIIKNATRSGPDQVQAIMAKLVKQDLDDISKGLPTNAERVKFTLNKIDTILAKETDLAKHQEFLELRKQYVDLTRDVPGVDPALREKPGKPMCGDPCPCDPKKDFLVPSRDDTYTREQIQNAQQHFSNRAKENPGGPDVRVNDDGRVTITRQKQDGTVVREETTLQILAQDQADNDALKEYLATNTDTATPIDDLFPLPGSDGDTAKIFNHVCGEGCDHGGSGGEIPSTNNLRHATDTTNGAKMNRAALRRIAPAGM